MPYVKPPTTAIPVTATTSHVAEFACSEPGDFLKRLLIAAFHPVIRHKRKGRPVEREISGSPARAASQGYGRYTTQEDQVCSWSQKGWGLGSTALSGLLFLCRPLFAFRLFGACNPGGGDLHQYSFVFFCGSLCQAPALRRILAKAGCIIFHDTAYWLSPRFKVSIRELSGMFLFKSRAGMELF
jgi:hypothetical protein